MPEVVIDEYDLDRDTTSEQDDVLEAGDITDFGDGNSGAISVESKVKMDNAQAARTLAYTLIFILAGSFFVHYGTTTWLTTQQIPTDSLNDLFENWLPVITTFVGSAVTYFLTKER